MQSFEGKGVKRQVFQPEKLQNHSNEGKGKEEKERRKRKSEEKERRRRKKQAMVALLVFIIATLKIVFGRKQEHNTIN